MGDPMCKSSRNAILCKNWHISEMAAAKPDKEWAGGGGRQAGENKRCWGMGWGRALSRQLLLFLNFFTTEPTAQRTLQLFFKNLFFKLKYSWFQCCVHFCCTAKWLSYTSTHILFYTLFIMVYPRTLRIVPCAVQEVLAAHPFHM